MSETVGVLIAVVSSCLGGTAAAVTASVLLGAHIVRVHGVREMVDVVRVADRIRRQEVGGRR